MPRIGKRLTPPVLNRNIQLGHKIERYTKESPVEGNCSTECCDDSSYAQATQFLTRKKYAFTLSRPNPGQPAVTPTHVQTTLMDPNAILAMITVVHLFLYL